MNGFIKKAALGLTLGAGLAGMSGCVLYRQLVDPCWPERYNHQARHATREAFNAQAYNGHVLDQTLFNHHFEPGTDKLNGLGMEHLKYLTRRRPVADPKIWVQTAQDVPKAGELAPDKLATARAELDAKRTEAIQRFLSGYLAGRPDALAFDVAIHDPNPGNHGLLALPITGPTTLAPTGAVPALYGNFQGVFSPATGLGGVGTGGGGGGGGATGGGGGGTGGGN